VIDAPPDASGAPRDDEGTAEHRVALVVLDFLREQPLGDGVGFRGWVLSTSPFSGEDDHRGVDLLTFHAAKGREWPTVIVTGVESGLVPHRSASTVDAKAEEARLLHVALTRAEERLVITRAARRRGYARQDSPLLAGVHEALAAVDGPAPPTAAPPTIDAYAADGRDERQLTVTLSAWRERTARAGSLLPDQICSDHDLVAIAAALPRSPAELSAVTGFGPVTAARHFDAIRAALDTVESASP
jgi:DNA helicase-2/ATP-dependent DNA helicase PcrA